MNLHRWLQRKYKSIIHGKAGKMWMLKMKKPFHINHRASSDMVEPCTGNKLCKIQWAFCWCQDSGIRIILWGRRNVKL
jgi:hypothetical protein